MIGGIAGYYVPRPLGIGDFVTLGVFAFIYLLLLGWILVRLFRE